MNSDRIPLRTHVSAETMRLNPHLWKPTTNETQDRGKVSDAKPQRHKAPALDCAISRKTEGIHRVVVRFTGFRVAPLDPDNFAGSCKDLLDGLRHAGLIPGDEAWRIKLETEQEKVDHFAEEKTVIEIVT